jgi:hypothetical protein
MQSRGSNQSRVRISPGFESVPGSNQSRVRTSPGFEPVPDSNQSRVWIQSRVRIQFRNRSSPGFEPAVPGTNLQSRVRESGISPAYGGLAAQRWTAIWDGSSLCAECEAYSTVPTPPSLKHRVNSIKLFHRINSNELIQKRWLCTRFIRWINFTSQVYSTG